MEFKNTVVLGTGTLPLSCALKIREFHLPVTIFDMEERPSSLLKKRAQAADIPYGCISPKKLFEDLAKSSEPTLLVSAINPFLLPKFLLENKQIFAINCHQALLPRHAGRNAEMWAIYEEDPETGITWHVLTSQIDAGDILIQKRFPLTKTHTAYQVFREQIRLAEEAFGELLPGLLANTLQPVPQTNMEARTFHYSYEVPNNGVLDVSWNSEKISAFLRAMDYSILNVVPSPKIIIKGSCFLWKKYRILEEQRFSEEIHIADDSIFIQKPGILFELCHYKKEDMISCKKN